MYSVKWIKKNAGKYLPPDFGGGGDYYADVCGEDIVTCTTAKKAKAVVEKVRSGAKVSRPVKICEA
jgi:hypothetical protein